MKTALERFTYLPAIRKLNELLRERRSLVEFTHFEESQHCGHGRNGASSLVNFKTTVIDAEQVYVARSLNDSKFRNHVEILVDSRVTAGQSGFGRRKTWRLIYRNGGDVRRIDVWCDTFSRDEFFDRNSEFCRLLPNEDFEKCKAGDSYTYMPNEELAAYVRLRSKRAEAESDRMPKLYEVMTAQGLELLEVIPYTHCIRARIEWVKQTDTSFEIGYWTKTTYNSLPQSIKVTWLRKPEYSSDAPECKRVKLADLGVEERGYYDHTDKMEVLPSQVDAVRRYMAAFNRKAKGGVK